MSISLAKLREVLFKQHYFFEDREARFAIAFNIVLQLLLIGMTSMILDGGVLGGICPYAAIGYWVAVTIIRFRRPIPTASDLAVIRAGYLPFCLVAFLALGCCEMLSR